MAHNRKNNHYHYAEKFSDRRRRALLVIPKRTLLFAMIFLLVFGVISTTFAAYLGNDRMSGKINEHSVIVKVRNAKADRDYALTGARADLASSGYNVTSGAKIYFYVPPSWNSTNIQIMIGHGSYSACYKMERVGPTTSTLYYYSMPQWNDFTQLCFTTCGSNAWNSEGNSPDHRKTYADCYTNTWGGENITAINHVFRAASGDDNANLAKEEYSNVNELLNSSFNVYAWTKNGGDANYGNSGAGGTVTVSGTTKNTNSATSYESTSQTTTTSTNSKTIFPMIGTDVTLSNNPTTGYSFDGYRFNDANGTLSTDSPIHMGSWRNEATNVYARFSEIMHTVNIANDVNSDVDTTASAVGVTTAKSVTAPSLTGYTFSSWTYDSNQITLTSGSASSASITFKYKTSATGVNNASTAVSLTANYTIKKPTSVTVSTTINSQAVTTCNVGDSVVLGATVSPAAPTGISYNVVYTASGGTISNGIFTASVPGTYTITASVTATDGTKTSAVTTGTKTITVYPAVPEWTLTMSGFDPNGSNGREAEGDDYAYGAIGNPYMVILGENFSFTAAVTNPLSNYTYTWHAIDAADNDTVIGTGSTLSFGSAQATDATTSNVRVKVYCVAYYNNASSLTTESEKITKWYYIRSLINSFTLSPFQKIYESPNDASLNALYNLNNGSGYQTRLWFSEDNRNYYEAKHANGLITGFNDVLSTYIDPSGVKYFYLHVSNNAGTLNAKTDVIHTTVGASSGNAVKPVYFINNEASTNINLKPDSDGYSKYRVMVFYIDGNGDLQRQTAQDVYRGVALKRGVRYRAYIPSDATEVSFAICKSGKYSAPVLSNDSIDYTGSAYYVDGTSDYTSPFFYAHTDLIELEEGKNTISATAKTLDSGYSSDDEYAMYTLTVDYQTFQSAD